MDFIFLFFFLSKLQFTYHQASIEDVQVTEEAFSSPLENIQHFKTWNFLIFATLVAILSSWIRIRIHWPIESGSN